LKLTTFDKKNGQKRTKTDKKIAPPTQSISGSVYHHQRLEIQQLLRFKNITDW
jgi:hypothetical protein